MKKQLHVLYISQYFPPEVGATQTRAYEMARNLVQMGHRVTVLTEFPNHPKGVIPPEYRGKWVVYDRLDGIDVIRTWVYTRPQKNFYTRMGFYMSFMLTGAFCGSLWRGPVDVLYVTSPPFFVGLTGLWLSRLKNARMVLELRDLWPQGAVELGELTNERFIRWAEWLERVYYRKADRIVVVTRGVIDRLVSQGVAKEKIRYIPNGSNPDLYYDHGDKIKSVLGLKSKFVVLYAGIFGIAQGMEFLCEVVAVCKTHKDMHFVFIGEGPLKGQVREIKERKQLNNLSLLDEVPMERIASYISAADVCLVPLKKIDLFTITLPSKLFDFMACQRPVVVSIDGEARRIVEESGGGVYVEPENIRQMKDVLLKLKSSPAKRRQMGKAGRDYVVKYYSRKQGARDVEQLLNELVR
jgi:glycosyltransferase involved in cell wall biosynthesis